MPFIYGAASLKRGGMVIRYTGKIIGKQVYLFDDEGKCIVERWAIEA